VRKIQCVGRVVGDGRGDVIGVGVDGFGTGLCSLRIIYAR